MLVGDIYVFYAFSAFNLEATSQEVPRVQCWYPVGTFYGFWIIESCVSIPKVNF